MPASLKGGRTTVDSWGVKSSHQVLCFRCGQQVGDPPTLNLIDEEPCPACAQRLLETLPGIFHTPYEPIGRLGEEQTEVLESDHSLSPDPPPEGA